jgi:subtilisin family serine protease
MKSRWPWGLLLLIACLATLAAPAIAGSAGSADALARRQVLVMLRVPPAHYRPDANYGNDYANAPGRRARRHIAGELARAHGLALRDEWPMPALGVDCFVLDAPDADTASREALALAADPRVESAQAMQLFHALAAPHAAGGDPLYAAQPATTAWHLSDLHAQATGKGVRIAVIDSGVAVDHPDLRGQVAVARNFVDDAGNVAEAHGTAVAGIIAARANGVGIVGIAPQARLLALRACWQRDAGSAACSSFTLARALQFAIDAHAQVLNLSLSGPDDRLLSRLLDAALQRGISVVGAVDAQARDGGFPASHPGVFAVDGLAFNGMSRTPAPLVLHAPGTGIPAPLPDGGWGLVSGASFATAQVSGLAALLLQRRPGLAPSQLLTLLEPAPGLTLALERPRAIDACAVMQRSAGHCVCACAAASAAR